MIGEFGGYRYVLLLQECSAATGGLVDQHVEIVGTRVFKSSVV